MLTVMQICRAVVNHVKALSDLNLVIIVLIISVKCCYLFVRKRKNAIYVKGLRENEDFTCHDTIRNQNAASVVD
jgi:hypothetical protein